MSRRRRSIMAPGSQASRKSETLLPPRAAEPQQPPLLQVESVSKLYAIRRWLRAPRFVHALRGVSLYLGRGETLGVVGETGSGKTTLARVILRLTQPTLGQIAFDGEPITDLSERALRALRRRFQPIFQDPRASLNPHLSVERIVSEGLRIHQLESGPSERNRLFELLDQVGISRNTLKYQPRELSAGERQRVAIARALAVQPELLVCDEPVSALDTSVQAQIVNLLLDLQQRHALAYLFISHDIRLVRFVSHRIAVMYAGCIVETGPASTLTESPLHPYTRALLNAVPEVDPDKRRLRIVLEGEPPDPMKPSTGCSFLPRCPRALADVCDKTPPPLEPATPASDQLVACYNPYR